MTIVDGKKIRNEILEKVKQEVSALPFQPLFCDVLVGNDPASVQYVEMKGRMAEEVGIAFYRANFPQDISTEDLIQEIKKLNEVPHMCGIIIQLPLPEHIDRQATLDAIRPDLDVDCLGAVASEKFYTGEGELGYPTALACMAILDSLNLDLDPSTPFDKAQDRSLGASKKIVVQGQGLLVGKPVTALLRFRGLDPVILTSKSENKEKILKEADVIISGIGKGKYITGEMIKEGVVIIDAGTSESNGGIVGDVDLESVKGIAGFVSPVPGGVGPVTVAILLHNVLTVAQSFGKTQARGDSSLELR